MPRKSVALVSAPPPQHQQITGGWEGITERRKEGRQGLSIHKPPPYSSSQAESAKTRPSPCHVHACLYLSLSTSHAKLGMRCREEKECTLGRRLLNRRLSDGPIRICAGTFLPRTQIWHEREESSLTRKAPERIGTSRTIPRQPQLQKNVPSGSG